MKRPARIGIFGGTFDPIHAGHLRAARLVQRRFRLDRILFVPASIPPHKARPDMAPARDRLRMTVLAVGGRPGWSVSPVEIRSRGPSYSIRTIEAMKRKYPRDRIFFLTGSDAFRDIRTWRRWRSVLRSCAFVVMTRPGVRLGTPRALGPAWRRSVHKMAPGERLDEGRLGPPAVFLLPIDALPISSTEIRERVRRGRPLAGLVPPAVSAYIRAEGLYRGPTAPVSRPALRTSSAAGAPSFALGSTSAAKARP